MALGGNGLTPQAVPLTWRMTRTGKMNAMALDHGAGSWERRVSLLFFPHTVPLATEWENWKVLEMDTTKEAPLSRSTPQEDCSDNGGTGIWGTEELGARWPQGQDVVLSAGTPQSRSMPGHEKCIRSKRLKSCQVPCLAFFN